MPQFHGSNSITTSGCLQTQWEENCYSKRPKEGCPDCLGKSPDQILSLGNRSGMVWLPLWSSCIAVKSKQIRQHIFYPGSHSVKTGKTKFSMYKRGRANWGLRARGSLPSSFLACISGQEPEPKAEETHQVQTRHHLWQVKYELIKIAPKDVKRNGKQF